LAVGKKAVGRKQLAGKQLAGKQLAESSWQLARKQLGVFVLN
jgi:hypothetical protein